MLLNKESHAILHEKKNPFLDKHKVLFMVDIVISVYIILNINVGCTKHLLFMYLTVVLKSSEVKTALKGQYAYIRCHCYCQIQ